MSPGSVGNNSLFQQAQVSSFGNWKGAIRSRYRDILYSYAETDYYDSFSFLTGDKRMCHTMEGYIIGLHSCVQKKKLSNDV